MLWKKILPGAEILYVWRREEVVVTGLSPISRFQSSSLLSLTNIPCDWNDPVCTVTLWIWLSKSSLICSFGVHVFIFWYLLKELCNGVFRIKFPSIIVITTNHTTLAVVSMKYKCFPFIFIWNPTIKKICVTKKLAWPCHYIIKTWWYRLLD